MLKNKNGGHKQKQMVKVLTLHYQDLLVSIVLVNLILMLNFLMNW